MSCGAGLRQRSEVISGVVAISTYNLTGYSSLISHEQLACFLLRSTTRS